MGAGLLACGLDYPGLSSLINLVLLPRDAEKGVAVGLGSFQINLAEKKFDREAGMFPPKALETDRH